MTGDRVARDRELLRAAQAQGLGPRLRAFARLSGPGWLQSAITLGGGSLAGSLYLGVLGGFSLLWLQVVAMLAGVVMLSAIAFVTLSTGERPFPAINRHVSPVLGWSWAIASLLASMVWCLPQFSLGVAAVQQNLLPGIAGTAGKVGVTVVLLGVATVVVWSYDRGARGVRVFDIVLKLMVAVIVISFFGVIAVMTAKGALDWGAALRGFVPDVSLLWSPAATFEPHLRAVAVEFQGYWRDLIVADQRDVMVTAAATAVGINMTFLLPYSMLARGWTREFRGLAAFDLFTGLLVPFVLATSCVVMASATQFHARPDEALVAGNAPPGIVAQYDRLLEARRRHAGDAAPASVDGLPAADRRMASMLVRRDAFDLAQSLTPLTGRGVAQWVFGIGVLGTALSTIIMLMLISGFVVCEMLGREARGPLRRWASLLAGVGVLGPFIWQGEARFWLAVPASVFGMTLLPIAYLTFLAMMNNRTLLGDARPQGGWRLALNLVLGIALALAALGAGWSVWSSTRWVGAAAVGGFLLLVLVVHVARRRVVRRGGVSHE